MTFVKTFIDGLYVEDNRDAGQPESKYVYLITKAFIIFLLFQNITIMGTGIGSVCSSHRSRYYWWGDRFITDGTIFTKQK